MVNDLGKLCKVIRSIKTREQFFVGKRYASLMYHKINHENNLDIRYSFALLYDIQDDLYAKGKEFGLSFKQSAI